MLWFYSTFSLAIFLALGITMILNKDNKAQETAGCIFLGIGVLGIFCLLIEFFVFGDFI